MTFESAVRVMFQRELEQKPAAAQEQVAFEAASHLSSATLRRHIRNAAEELKGHCDLRRDMGKSADLVVVAAMLNAFFEFGYRVRRIESETL